MKKPIDNGADVKHSAHFCRRMALLLLCPLAIAGCDIQALKPPVFDMTPLNRDGSVNDGKDYAGNPWSCVQDNISGLVWEVKKTGPGLHDIKNTYSWYDPNPESNGGFAGKANGGTCAGSDCDTQSYVKAVNAEKLCGFDDWYLPSRFELGTIIDSGVFFPGPTIPKAYSPRHIPPSRIRECTGAIRHSGRGAPPPGRGGWTTAANMSMKKVWGSMSG